MFVSPRDRLNIRDALSMTRLVSRKLYVLIPTLTSVTYDADLDSGKDISSGDGTGQTATWAIYQIYANIRQVDNNLMAYGHVPPGVEIGDAFFTIGTRDKTLLTSAYDTKDAYLFLDNETYRVVSLTSAGVGQTEEWVVGIKKYNPLFRQTGY